MPWGYKWQQQRRQIEPKRSPPRPEGVVARNDARYFDARVATPRPQHYRSWREAAPLPSRLAARRGDIGEDQDRLARRRSLRPGRGNGLGYGLECRLPSRWLASFSDLAGRIGTAHVSYTAVHSLSVPRMTSRDAHDLLEFEHNCRHCGRSHVAFASAALRDHRSPARLYFRQMGSKDSLLARRGHTCRREVSRGIRSGVDDERSVRSRLKRGKRARRASILRRVRVAVSELPPVTLVPVIAGQRGVNGRVWPLNTDAKAPTQLKRYGTRRFDSSVLATLL
jgi:hypothetical protein